jgi:hypothetical protein
MEDHLEENIEDETPLIENLPYFPSRIFEGIVPERLEEIPTGFDAVMISLDGRTQSNLDWKKERIQAKRFVEKGYFLMWEMRLGLFGDLAQPLVNQTQFLTLALALDHFLDSLGKEFKSHTLGLSLFRGNADFSHRFPWDSHQEQNLKEWLQEIGHADLASLDLLQLQQHLKGQQLIRLFCRDVAVEYLALLAARMPDSLAPYLYLDASSLNCSSVNEIQLLNPERFNRLRLALKGHRLPFEALGWELATAQGYSGRFSVELPPLPSISIGVCIPPCSFDYLHHDQGFEEGLDALQKQSIPFRLIAESQLTSQWDHLDFLLYSPSGLSRQGKRMLQGFCAAGGTVISTGDLSGFPHEMSLGEWKRLLLKIV